MAWLGRLKGAAAAAAAGSSVAPAVKALKRRHTPLCDGLLPTGSDFIDGSFLDKWCQRCVHVAVREVGRPSLPERMIQNVTSVCTGSGMDHMVLDSCGRSLQKESIPIGFDIPVTCEMNPGKDQWTQSLRKWTKIGGNLHCNFTALQDTLHCQVLFRSLSLGT